MDDFVIIHHDKDYLKKCKDIIEEKLKNEYKLELNAKSTIYDINNGFDFLGYTYKVKNNKTIISISRKTFKNIRKTCLDCLENQDMKNNLDRKIR